MEDTIQKTQERNENEITSSEKRSQHREFVEILTINILCHTLAEEKIGWVKKIHLGMVQIEKVKIEDVSSKERRPHTFGVSACTIPYLMIKMSGTEPKDSP